MYFVEERLGCLFVGDLIYNGALYLHLQDSSLDSYEESLHKLKLEANRLANPTIWPCHNDIPLPAGYVHSVLQLVDQVLSRSIKPMRIWAADVLFAEGLVYQSSDVCLVVKESQVRQTGTST